MSDRGVLYRSWQAIPKIGNPPPSLFRRTDFSSGYELTFHTVTVRNPKLVNTTGFACRSGILSGIISRFV
jgi:hypothetical protein